MDQKIFFKVKDNCTVIVFTNILSLSLNYSFLWLLRFLFLVYNPLPNPSQSFLLFQTNSLSMFPHRYILLLSSLMSFVSPSFPSSPPSSLLYQFPNFSHFWKLMIFPFCCCCCFLFLVPAIASSHLVWVKMFPFFFVLFWVWGLWLFLAERVAWVIFSLE